MLGMHTLSTFIGAIFPLLLSKTMTEILCVILFLGFGIYMIY
jgi:putative Ca2+/H+ antiporter (TMEM165/GDT1 family)